MSQRLYLDVCCLNRPFDDWRQQRVRLEGEAILAILERCNQGDLQLVNSAALEAEISRTADPERRQRVLAALAVATQTIQVTEAMMQRAATLQEAGFTPFDALHLACAEAAAVDRFLTTDDRLLRRARPLDIPVPVANPVTWIMTEETLDSDNTLNGD
jgi:predicted nucleic acid-binding protein